MVMTANWHECAHVEVTHTCDGVQHWLEASGVPDDHTDKPVCIGLQCFAAYPSRRINTLAVHSRMLFREFGCDCSPGQFECGVRNVGGDFDEEQANDSSPS